ncbi:MAG: rhodanese-like domain-containing protein [Pseudomonadota bacterium]|nr:rhodanese-like domain-containing protein [Pseudomonadota bacterium]
MIEDLGPKEFQQALNENEVFLIDVREKWEFEICKIDGAVNLPMSTISETYSDLDSSLNYSLYCHHGVRSMQVANFLLSNGFNTLFNLRGGIDAWSKEIDDSVERY